MNAPAAFSLGAESWHPSYLTLKVMPDGRLPCVARNQRMAPLRASTSSSCAPTGKFSSSTRPTREGWSAKQMRRYVRSLSNQWKVKLNSPSFIKQVNMPMLAGGFVEALNELQKHRIRNQHNLA